MERKAFVLGHPISHSRSPLIHGYWLAKYQIEGLYEAIDINPADLRQFVDSLKQKGFVGGNVTLPFKEAVADLVDVATMRARNIGAVNTIIAREDGLIAGDNTDALGFVAHLESTLGSAWFENGERVVSIAGSGGAARGIVVGLLERGVKQIQVFNRTLERAEAVAELNRSRITVIDWSRRSDALDGSDLLVNTTSMGMLGHPPLDVDLSVMRKDAAVADIVYAPLKTPLLQAAERNRLKTVDGLGMLLHQAVPGFEAWFGVRPQVTDELRERVAQDLAR